MNKTIYRSFPVWDRSEQGLYRYRMFENPLTGKCSVQMQVFFGQRSSIPKDLLLNLDTYFIELLAEMSPEDRGGQFDTIQEAIAAFDEPDAEVEKSDRP